MARHEATRKLMMPTIEPLVSLLKGSAAVEQVPTPWTHDRSPFEPTFEPTFPVLCKGSFSYQVCSFPAHENVTIIIYWKYCSS